MRVPFQLCTSQAVALNANRSQATFQVNLQTVLGSLFRVGCPVRLLLANHMISGAFAPTLTEGLTYQTNALCVLLSGPQWETTVSDSNRGSVRRCLMVRSPASITNRANEALAHLFRLRDVTETWQLTVVLPQQTTSSNPTPVSFAGALTIPTHTFGFVLDFLPYSSVPADPTPMPSKPNAQLLLSTLDIQNNGKGVFLNTTRTLFEFRGIDLRAVMGRAMWERYTHFNLTCVCLVGCPLSTAVTGEVTTSLAILSGLEFGPRNRHTQLPVAQRGVLMGQCVWTSASFFIGNTPDQLSPPHTFRKGNPIVNLQFDNVSVPTLTPLNTATYQSYDAPNGCMPHQLFFLRFDGVEED